jgi:hypothetical protein
MSITITGSVTLIKSFVMILYLYVIILSPCFSIQYRYDAVENFLIKSVTQLSLIFFGCIMLCFSLLFSGDHHDSRPS